MNHPIIHGHASIATIENFYIRRLSSEHGFHNPMPPARATIHCFFFLKSGMVTIIVAERRINVVAGECLIVPSGQVFSVVACEGDVDGYMGGFHTDYLLKTDVSNISSLSYLYGWLSNPIQLLGRRLQYISNIFERIYDEWTSKCSDLSLIRSYLISFLLELNNLKSSNQNSSGDNAAKYITENFMRMLSSSDIVDNKIDDYAAKLGVTTGHLTKCVSKMTGKSTSKWIEEKIMMEAKMLLYQTNLSINEISQKVGIQDASYFSRVFKKSSGMTPNEFRRMIKKS